MLSMLFRSKKASSRGELSSDAPKFTKTYEIHSILDNIAAYKKDQIAELILLVHLYDSPKILESYQMDNLLSELFTYFSPKFMFYFINFMLTHANTDVNIVFAIHKKIKENSAHQLKAMSVEIFDADTNALCGIKIGDDFLVDLIKYYCRLRPSCARYLLDDLIPDAVKMAFDYEIHREILIALIKKYDLRTISRLKQRPEFQLIMQEPEIALELAVLPFQHQSYLQDPSNVGGVFAAQRLIEKREANLAKLKSPVMSAPLILRYQMMQNVTQDSKLRLAWSKFHTQNSQLFVKAVKQYMAQEPRSAEQQEALHRAYFKVHYDPHTDHSENPCDPARYTLDQYPSDLVVCLSDDDKAAYAKNFAAMNELFEQMLAIKEDSHKKERSSKTFLPLVELNDSTLCSSNYLVDNFIVMLFSTNQAIFQGNKQKWNDIFSRSIYEALSALLVKNELKYSYLSNRQDVSIGLEKPLQPVYLRADIYLRLRTKLEKGYKSFLDGKTQELDPDNLQQFMRVFFKTECRCLKNDTSTSTTASQPLISSSVVVSPRLPMADVPPVALSCEELETFRH